MCNIIGCDHKARKATVGSWRDLGICSCCAFELYLMNQTLGILSQYKRYRGISKCRTAYNPNPLGIPTRQAMLQLIEERPLKKKQLREELKERFGYSISKATFLKHFNDLKDEKLIKEVDTYLYRNMELIMI